MSAAISQDEIAKIIIQLSSKKNSSHHEFWSSVVEWFLYFEAILSNPSQTTVYQRYEYIKTTPTTTISNMITNSTFSLKERELANKVNKFLQQCSQKMYDSNSIKEEKKQGVAVQPSKIPTFYWMKKDEDLKEQ